MDVSSTSYISDNTFKIFVRSTGNQYKASPTIRVVIACRSGHTFSVNGNTGSAVALAVATNAASDTNQNQYL
jgi:hypothetical protein